MSTKENVSPVQDPKPKKKTSAKSNKKKETKPKYQRGLVADCARLNVRSLAVMTSGVTAILERGDAVLIDPEKSTDGWYSVKIKNGKTGYCMKKYIKVLKE